MADTAKPKIFFPNLMIEMKKNCISQNKLADMSGINRWSMVNKMRGKNDFTLQNMRKIQEVFPGCTLDYLFTAEKRKE